MPLTAKEIFCLAVWYASFRSKLIAVEIGFNAITEASPKKKKLLILRQSYQCTRYMGDLRYF